MSRKVKRQFPGTTSYLDRHGRRRWRYRKNGRSVELGAHYGSEEFRKRYESAASNIQFGGTKPYGPRSFFVLTERFYQTPRFQAYASSSKKKYKQILGKFLDDHGEKSAAKVRVPHLRKILQKMQATPQAANDLRSLLQLLLDLALDLEWRIDNPVTHIKPYATARESFHTWSEEEITKFEATHAKGSLANTAMQLMLCTGASRADVVKLGPKNLVGDRIRYKRQKTETRGGVTIDIPLHPTLASLLKTLTNCQNTFLELPNGKQRSPAGLGNSMRDWCNEAGLAACTSHGLRIAMARRLAEAGCTPHEIMSITGHQDLDMVTLYTRAANKEGLADEGMGLI